MIFCDTAALQTAVYSEYYFSDTSLHAQARQWHTRFALTLLMMPDLPWVSDHFLRDGATAQSAVHRLLVRELASQQGVVTVSGTGLARLNSAINAIQEQMPLQCAAHRGCAPQGALRNTPFT